MTAAATSPPSAAPSWQPRNCINLLVGGGGARRQVMPLVVHLLRQDLQWFNSHSSTLWPELQSLLTDNAIAPHITKSGGANGEKGTAPAGAAAAADDDDTASTASGASRKKARRSEKLVQGHALQFVYRFRATKPVFSVISLGGSGSDSGSGSNAGSKAAFDAAKSPTTPTGGRPSYESLPVCASTLLVWVYKFDPGNPYAPLPTETVEALPITSFFPIGAPPPRRGSGSSAGGVSTGGASSGVGVADAEDEQLRLAIELSLRESRAGNSDGGGDGGGSACEPLELT